jgi:hypothetical protein
MTPKKSNGSGRGINVYLTMLVALLSVLTARADLQFDTFVGYDQLLPEHGWFPIICELHNDGPSFNAVIEVTAGEWGGGQVRRFPIDLPTNTRKRVVIPVYSSGQIWNARLVDSHGNVRAEQTASNIKVMGNHMPLVGALARTVGGMPVFPGTSETQWTSRFVAARLQSSLFPDNPLALEGLGMLYISSEKASELNVGQVTALMAWLENGGHLVIGVEQISDLAGAPWLHDIFPCDLTTTGTAPDHDALQEWSKTRAPIRETPVHQRTRRRPGANAAPMFRSHAGPPPGSARATPVAPDVLMNDVSAGFPEDGDFNAAPLQVVTGTARDGKILIGDKDVPLAFEGKRGRGRITVLCFSPEREPFLSWKGRGWFWAKLADVPITSLENLQNQQGMGQMSSDGIFGAMIDSRQIRKLPLGWLLALLAAYLVVIGPLDQYWLKKINRQMLTWITFPGYVVLFSGLIYWIGFHLRAGELEWNELNMVDVLPHDDRAVLRGETYVSIYSPVNQNYTMGSEQAFATMRAESQGYYGGNLESSRISVVQRGNNFEAEAVVPVWTSQLYVSDWLQSAPDPVTMSVKRNDSGWTVTIENKLDHALPQARVVIDGRIYNIGELDAGKSRTMALDPNSGESLQPWAQQFGGNFANAAQSRRNSFGNNERSITDLATSSMAVSFLSQVNNQQPNTWQTFSGPDGLDLSRYAESGYGILLAWDPDHALNAPLNRFSVKRTHRNTLLRLVVPVNS